MRRAALRGAAGLALLLAAAPAWAQDPGEPPEAELPEIPAIPAEPEPSEGGGTTIEAMRGNLQDRLDGLREQYDEDHPEVQRLQQLIDEIDNADPEALQALQRALAGSKPPPVSKDGMPVKITDCPGAEEFGGSEDERAGFCQLLDGSIPEQEKFVAVRTWADKALRADPRSYRAHFLMGAAQHQGEGNLPKSLFHLERADELLTNEAGQYLPTTHPAAPVLRRILLELVYVHGEMDHHAEKIRFVDVMHQRLGIDYSALKAWPLMKLKRWDEARIIAQQAIDGEDPGSYWPQVGLTALCAIESERRNRQGAYDACMAAARPVMKNKAEGGVALSNAASASVEMFKFDEAEKLWLESSTRPIEGTINPWGRLTHLYLREGRFAEALSALREMRTYRLARPAYYDQQDQADAELTGASLLMIAGRVEDALRITSRVSERPDRQGTSSAAFEQNQGGNFIFDRAAKLDVARRLEERAVSAGWKDALVLRAKAAKLRLDAWSIGRRAAVILSDPERLITTLRPECPGSIEMPAWLDADVIQVVGPGVALAAIAQARREETLPEHLVEPVFAGLEAEAYLAQGDDRRALEKAELAAKGLLPAEALLRARAAAVGAEAARRLGKYADAVRLLGNVLTVDPGVIRRLGFKLPLEVLAEGDSPAVREAKSALESSPLFDVGTWGFRLTLSETAVALSLPDGSELTRVPVKAGKKDDDSLARRIARAAHEDLLVPQVDVTQADVRSLDGGLGGGGRASERAKSVLEEVVGP